MSRSAMMLAGLTLAAAGCVSTRAEEQTLRDFFQASRARDKTMLAKVATVSLDLVTEGTVRDFEVTGTGAEHLEVTMVSKPVAVTAQVRTPDGHIVPTRLEFDFRRALQQDSQSGRESPWIITAVRRPDR